MVYENDEKKHCPRCKSSIIKLHGKTKQGKQRYQCLECNKTYLWKQRKNIYDRRYSWFKDWILEGFTIKQLSRINKVSPSTVSRVIDYWLNIEPPRLQSLGEIKHIILDGTYINHRTGLYVVMNGDNHKIVYGDYGVSETGKHLKVFYNNLQQKGLNPLSATVDGSLQQLKYLKDAWDSLVIQRCLVHIQRQGLSWLRKLPKRTEAIKLREILLQVMYIKTKEESDNFINGFHLWENRYGLGLSRSTNRGKVFSDLLRTRSMLRNALPNMFSYLDYPEISKTTNALEGYFGRLKQKYRIHRGLSPHKRKSYFRWYLYLKHI